jgi:hypothetical protein
MCAAQMNVTAKARYVTAVGGAAWVAAPYAYTRVPLGQFFSPYVGAWVVVGCGHPAVTLRVPGAPPHNNTGCDLSAVTSNVMSSQGTH